jgi:hypothetical protein
MRLIKPIHILRPPIRAWMKKAQTTREMGGKAGCVEGCNAFYAAML